MDNLAEQLSSEERAYFGDETLAKHVADLEGFPAETVEPQAPAEPAAKAPEPPVEPDASIAKPSDRPADQRTVDHGAFHAVREENKELKARHAQLEGRFNEVLARLAPQQPAAEAPKPIEEDPIAAIKRHDEWVAGQRQAETQQQQFRQFADVVTRHEASFRAETPDYDAALNHLHTARSAEYEALGLSPPEIQQALHTDAINVAAHALRTGKSPAAVAYSLAKARGYAPAAAKEAEPAVAAPEVTEEKKMEMLQRGVAASKTLEGGTGGVGELSIAALANMDSKEIGALSEAQWRKMMLGA